MNIASSYSDYSIYLQNNEIIINNCSGLSIKQEVNKKLRKGAQRSRREPQRKKKAMEQWSENKRWEVRGENAYKMLISMQKLCRLLLCLRQIAKSVLYKPWNNKEITQRGAKKSQRTAKKENEGARGRESEGAKDGEHGTILNPEIFNHCLFRGFLVI